jgi:tripartite-type tricarboxylate transporter receptor subunit TctC
MHPATPRIHRRTLLVALAGAGLAPALRAQDYPSKPVKLIVSFPPGSGADTTARHFAKRLQELTQQSFVVDNRPGANSFIAAQAVAKAEPDGTTLFFSSNSPVVVNPVLFKKLPYDPVADFAPVARAARAPNLLVVSAASPHKSVADVVAAAKKNPGKLSYASGSAAYHIATEAFNEAVGIEANHIPYKGAAPAITDTAGGTVDFAIVDITAALPLVQSGKLRALAVTSDKRHADLPNVPTAIESGAKGYEFYNWTALYAPAKTPQPVIDKLEQLMQQISKEPETLAFFAKVGGEPFPAGAKELRTYQASQLDFWQRAAKRANLQPE